MLLKREREKFVFSTENITFAILICIVRFLVKESASITMCSFTNTLCVITGDSKKGYNIGIPSIIHWIGKPPTVKLEVFAFYDHYSRISKYSTICFLEVANPYISTFFSHKSSTRIILFANLNHFETYLFPKKM